MSVSTGPRQRTNCQACGARCQVKPLELQIHGGSAWRGHWKWSSHILCPPCQAAYTDFVQHPEQLLKHLRGG